MLSRLVWSQAVGATVVAGATGVTGVTAAPIAAHPSFVAFSTMICWSIVWIAGPWSVQSLSASVFNAA